MRRLFLSSVVIVGTLLLAAVSSRAQGVTDTQVLVGTSSAQSGPAAFLGQSMRKGMEAYFDRINRDGGIHGRKIKLIVYDDRYEPVPCVQNTRKLINKDKVFALIGYVGTPTSNAAKPIVEKAKVPFLFPFTGAKSLRQPVSKYIFNYRASYFQETAEMVRGLVKELGIKSIGIFYQADAYGGTIKAGALTAMRKYGLKPVVEGTYKRNTTDVSAAVKAFLAKKPEAVIMGGAYAACAEFIKQCKQQGYDPIFLNVSFVGPDKLAELLGPAGEGEVVTQVVPPPTNQRVALVREYLKDMKRKGYKPDFVSLEGYIAAKIFCEALQQCGKELTREKLVKTLESMRSFDIGLGYKLGFSPNDHQASDKVYPTIVRNGKYQLLKSWKSVPR